MKTYDPKDVRVFFGGTEIPTEFPPPLNNLFRVETQFPWSRSTHAGYLITNSLETPVRPRYVETGKYLQDTRSGQIWKLRGKSRSSKKRARRHSRKPVLRKRREVLRMLRAFLRSCFIYPGEADDIVDAVSVSWQDITRSKWE